MFAYNPTVNDRSGELLAMGQMGAAQTNAQTMGQLGQDIGGALAGIGQMYGEIEGNKAKGRAFKDVFKVVAPTVGMSMDQLEDVAGGKLKNDMDWYNVSQSIGPMMPALINLQLGQDKLGVQRAQPFVAADLQNRRNIAGGNTTFTPGGGAPDPGPVLMDGADPNKPLPAVVAAPTPAPSIPGGRASWDAANRRRESRGLKPLPYPPGI
jgi:hypothetical protein